MFATFSKALAEGPAELQHAQREGGTSREEAVRAFEQGAPGVVTVKCGELCSLSYTHDGQEMRFPRQLAATDNIFCLFAGNLENLPQLRQMYGLSRHVTEVQLVMEVYKVLRDRSPYSADQVIADLRGTFSFILYDHHSDKVFLAVDPEGKASMWWGHSTDGDLVVSDNASLVKAACGNSFAPFPKGCFFSTAHGLQSFVQPNGTLKPVPHVDSQGKLCGSNFKLESKQDASSPMETRKANWLNSF